MRYGAPEVVEIRDVEKPVPKDDEVLVAVRAASVRGAKREPEIPGGRAGRMH